jgi:hypothetical protein
VATEAEQPPPGSDNSGDRKDDAQIEQCFHAFPSTSKRKPSVVTPAGLLKYSRRQTHWLSSLGQTTLALAGLHCTDGLAATMNRSPLLKLDSSRWSLETKQMPRHPHDYAAINSLWNPASRDR